MRILYDILYVIEFARVNIILIEIIINIFSFNFIFKAALKDFRVQYIFYYSFLEAFNNDYYK